MSGVPLFSVLSLDDSLSMMNCRFNGEMLSSRLRRMSGADSVTVCTLTSPFLMRGIMSKLVDSCGMLASVSPARSAIRIESIVSLLGKVMFTDVASKGMFMLVFNLSETINASRRCTASMRSIAAGVASNNNTAINV